MSEQLQASVVVVGSGMGGATTALALARRGVDVLVLERGERLPREPENWSPRAVFVDRRYKPARDTGSTAAGAPFRAGRALRGRRQHEGLRREPAAAARAATSSAVEHLEGTSPAWPFALRATSSPTTREAERLYRVHGTTGEDPTEPWRSTAVPVSRRSSTSRTSPTWPTGCARRACTRAPTRWASTGGPGGACIRCGTCDGFPCLRRTPRATPRPARIDPALATGNVRLRPARGSRRIVTDRDRTPGRPPGRRRAGRAGRGHAAAGSCSLRAR